MMNLIKVCNVDISNGVYNYLGYHSSNLSNPEFKRRDCKYVFFVKMTFLNHVRFTKRLQYIIVLAFCLTFSHKYKMELWKDNCGIPLKLLLMWDREILVRSTLKFEGFFSICLNNNYMHRVLKREMGIPIDPFHLTSRC